MAAAYFICTLGTISITRRSAVTRTSLSPRGPRRARWRINCAHGDSRSKTTLHTTFSEHRERRRLLRLAACLLSRPRGGGRERREAPTFSTLLERGTRCAAAALDRVREHLPLRPLSG